ncbi:hypothetical protein H6501_01620 [Candidatus Woesearchaeota archaeon]|nr:hypothetical protein [Nanoarchaeota archaeon]MCB9370274.1 hypothetical protein [Candidatus Woesearchaeota archaeon]USN44798.1 MAG: hypothetical protein H6500_03065 [Candidatus Woesearchaeota archaeon]
MVKRDSLTNYLLTLGFISVIILFMLLLVQISRVVFENANVLGEHVIQTKGLLEDIEEVKEATNQENYDETQHSAWKNKADLVQAACALPAQDSFVLKVNSTKSVLGFTLPETVYTEDGLYYSELSEREKEGDDKVYVYNLQGLQRGFFVAEKANGNYTMYNLADALFEEIEPSQIRGVFLFRDEEWND